MFFYFYVIMLLGGYYMKSLKIIFILLVALLLPIVAFAEDEDTDASVAQASGQSALQIEFADGRISVMTGKKKSKEHVEGTTPDLFG